MSCVWLFFFPRLWRTSHCSENEISTIRAPTHKRSHARQKLHTRARELAISLKAHPDTTLSRPLPFILSTVVALFAHLRLHPSAQTKHYKRSMQKHAHNEWQYTIINTLHTERSPIRLKIVRLLTIGRERIAARSPGAQQESILRA